METFVYKDKQYPDYIRRGNAVEHIIPTAQKFCKGVGLDVGGTIEWHFPDALIVNKIYSAYDALNLPTTEVGYDYIFSSHCLEHVDNYIEVLEYWLSKIRPQGQLFLYLPHPEMDYWRPENCRKHLHLFHPKDMVKVFETLGLEDVFHSERDLYYSFAITGRKK